MSHKPIDRQRREFLAQGAGTVVGAGALLATRFTHADTLKTQAKGIPPHRAIELPGVHAYAQRSITAGNSVQFRVSSSVPYQLSICRLAGEVDDATSDIVLHTLHEPNPRQQAIHPGSYIQVAKGFPANTELESLTFECWVRPWRLDTWQGLITQHDFPQACGIGLFINPEGRLALHLGNGQPFNETNNFIGAQLNHRRWNHVAGTWDGKRVVLWVNGRKSGAWDHTDTVLPGDTSIRLGAYGHDGEASRFFDGDLAMPTIYRRALTAEQIQQRIKDRGLVEAREDPSVFACWPLSEETGDDVADVGPDQRHGKIINHATWMIGGPSFHGDQIGRHDRSYDPTTDTQRGHGLRFASDDLYDCRWDVTHEFKIPADLPGGVHVGRFDYQIDGKPYQYHVTFNVRRPPTRPKAPILVLLSSNTWIAYNAAPFPVPTTGLRSVSTNGLPNAHPDAPAFSCYLDHRYGQPAYYFGMNMPWPAASPEWTYLHPKMQYSHLMRGELFLHRWLDGFYGDHDGYAYDVITDHDLHRNPEILEGYQTLFINGHSEYWSAEAYRGVDAFLSSGGTVVALSGNTMFWRTSFSPDGNVMECRKFDPRIGGRGGATVGELYHSQDKQRGSLMRECDLPAWRCLGLDCCGWGGATDGAYHTELPDHFLFQEPENVELVKSETFGHARDAAYPMAIGHEWDIRLDTLRKMTRNVPDGAELPEEPAGITTLATGKRYGGALTIDYFTNNAPPIAGVCAELIYWKRPTGGRVFHAGSIAAGSALSADPKWQTVMRNVLHHFGVQPKRS